MTKILVTNDDGITTTGIAKLAQAMARIGEVFVVAPDREMSAISHALSLSKPLHVKEIQKNWFAVGGTPTDCVYLGLKSLAPDVDIVVSGINKGANLGEDVHYSGTVAGATEASILGKPAIAFSQILGDDPDLDRAANFAEELTRQALNYDIGKRPLLNVNFPPCKPKGVRLTRLGVRHYEDTLTEKVDDAGNRTFLVAGTAVHYEQDKDTDCQVAEEGFISVSPLQLDLSDYEAHVKMASWDVFKG